MPGYWQRTLEHKLNRRGFLALLAAAGVSGALIACTSESSDSSDAAGDSTSTTAGRPKGWIEATHGDVEAAVAAAAAVLRTAHERREA